jgi:hypothetical protein
LDLNSLNAVDKIKGIMDKLNVSSVDVLLKKRKRNVQGGLV